MRRRPRALDLFCGAGGVSMGLYRAGFDVLGVDIIYQPRYPFKFAQADALSFSLEGFDYVWASPPCQLYSRSSAQQKAKGKIYPDLIPSVRTRLEKSGKLFTIENVIGAPLHNAIILDGIMFPELRVIRRRVFESNFLVLRPHLPIPKGLIAKGYSCVVGGGRCSGAPVESNAWHTAEAKRKAMGIDWMNREELSQAIPPEYSKYIGKFAIQALSFSHDHRIPRSTDHPIPQEVSA